jgi:hypothetical protein
MTDAWGGIMSSIPSFELDEWFVRDFYVSDLTDDEIQTVLKAWEPFRERIEYLLGDFEPEEQSWRSYRNSAFEWLCDHCPLNK